MAKANLSADAQAIIQAVNDLRTVVEDLCQVTSITNSVLSDVRDKIEEQTKELKNAVFEAAQG